eukprot:TRINITY_DN2247_c0_g1_i1.p1 TRINITY_DN2247_c0_g1~~TRINITY_DN2247_c0_g1_i1.p1  ORF type:complete len:277 (-),score=86.89 TRINITY_DN2247_c0_g1_i1:232-1062(-)
MSSSSESEASSSSSSSTSPFSEFEKKFRNEQRDAYRSYRPLFKPLASYPPPKLTTEEMASGKYHVFWHAFQMPNGGPLVLRERFTSHWNPVGDGSVLRCGRAIGNIALIGWRPFHQMYKMGIIPPDTYKTLATSYTSCIRAHSLNLSDPAAAQSYLDRVDPPHTDPADLPWTYRSASPPHYAQHRIFLKEDDDPNVVEQTFLSTLKKLAASAPSPSSSSSAVSTSSSASFSSSSSSSSSSVSASSTLAPLDLRDLSSVHAHLAESMRTNRPHDQIS